MRERLNIRFGVKDQKENTSGIWRVWSNKNDVYFSPRNIAGALKFSFHESQSCRFAITQEHITKMDHQDLEIPEDRCIHEWERTPILKGKVFQPARIVIPHSALQPKDGDSPEDVIWLEPPNSTGAIHINLLYTLCPFEDITDKDKSNIELVGQIKLPNGQYFLLIAKNDFFDMEGFIKNNQNREGVANFLTSTREFTGKNLRGIFLCPEEANNLINIVELAGKHMPKNREE